MDSNYRLHVVIGVAKFEAEGPEGTVKDDFKRFLQAVSTIPPQINEKLAPEDRSDRDTSANRVDRALLDRVFARQGDIVSLRLLPPDNQHRVADSAILLIYGFSALMQLQEVPVTRLNEGLRQSGLSVNRLDRFIVARSPLYRKGGTRSGGRYSLSNLGFTTAETWLIEWFG